MNLKTFKENKQIIVEKCKAVNACKHQFAKLLKSVNYDQLFKVLSDNCEFVDSNNILNHITSLPADLKVSSSLDLNGCTGLTSLPADLKVSGYLDLSGCTGLTSIKKIKGINGTIYR